MTSAKEGVTQRFIYVKSSISDKQPTNMWPWKIFGIHVGPHLRGRISQGVKVITGYLMLVPLASKRLRNIFQLEKFRAPSGSICTIYYGRVETKGWRKFLQWMLPRPSHSFVEICRGCEGLPIRWATQICPYRRYTRASIFARPSIWLWRLYGEQLLRIKTF